MKLFFSIALVLLISSASFADEITLKSGKKYRNVKTFIGKKQVRIAFENGRKKYVAKKQIASLVRKKVRWKPRSDPKKLAEEKRKKEEEERKQEEAKKQAEAQKQKEIDEQAKQEAAKKREEEQRKRKEAERLARYDWGVPLRSAILPGWGHYYKGQKVFAYTYAGLFFASAIYAASSYLDFQSKQNAYNSTLYLPVSELAVYNYIQFDSRFASASSANSQLQTASAVVGVLYFSQLAHSFYIARGVQIQVSAQPEANLNSLTFNTQPIQIRQYQFRLQTRF
ncbi:MAG: hypothetical protein AAF518_22955 [Spirochaetota bacterium]